MSFPQGAALYSQNAGIVPAGLNNVLVLQSAPTSSTINGPAGALLVGQRAVVPNSSVWELIGFTSGPTGTSANWVQLSSSSGDVLSITGTANQIVASSPTGDVTLSMSANYILGTANQITSTPSSGSTTLSLPSALVAPGSFTALSGNITAANGNLTILTLGRKLSIATGVNSSVGVTSAMSGTPGTVSVSSSAVTTSSQILFSRATAGGTLGNVSISSQTTGNFTLLSDQNETSTFNYLIIN